MLAAALLALSANSLAPASGATGRTERISESSAGAQGNADTPARSVPDTTSPQLSLDGRWAAFSSDATNLVPGDTNGVADVFLRDLHTGRTTRLSEVPGGGQANGASYSPSLSVDGRWVAFASEASNLVPGDTNRVADIFLLDRRRGRMRRISVGPGGAQADGASNTPFVSLFGQWITFESAATNLARRDGNGMPDAFFHVRRSGRTVRIAPKPLARPDADRFVTWTARPTISYDGAVVSFLRRAAERDALQDLPRVPGGLVPPPPTIPGVPSAPDSSGGYGVDTHLQASDLYVRDRARGRDRRVELPKWNARFRVLADRPTISADGKRVVFEAQSVLDAEAAMNLTDPTSSIDGPDRTLGDNAADVRDVWLYDRMADSVLAVSRNVYGLAGDAASWGPQISSEGHTVAFVSEATNLVPGDENGVADVFVYDSRERALSRISVADDGSYADGASQSLSMSYDGRHLVYSSAASNLTRSDTNNRLDVFHHDRRTHLRNRPPNLISPDTHVRTILVGDEHELQLRARDPDRDPIRYGILIALPPGNAAVSNPGAGSASQTYDLDPARGTFRWRPTPNQEGPWTFAFWVSDLRGGSEFEIARYVVRNPAGASLCTVRGDC